MDSNIQFKDYNPGDPTLINSIVSQLKSQGLFDQFRKECIADVDTKPAYQNLRHRVDSFLSSYLSKLTWTPNLNKNQLRESIRKYVNESPFLEQGVERVVEQVVNPKIHPVLVPKVEHVVHEMIGSTKKINEYKPVVNTKYSNDAIPDNNNFPENKNTCSSMNYDHADNDDDEVSPPFEPHKQFSDTYVRFSDSDSNEYVEKKRIKIDNERNNATSPNENNSEETAAAHLSEEDSKIKFPRESDKPYKSKSKLTDSAKTSKEDKHQRDSDKGASSGGGKHHTSRSTSKYSSSKDKEKKVKDNREKEKRDDSKDKSGDKKEWESKKSIKDESKRKNKDSENDKENPSSSSEQKHSSRRHKSDHHRDDKHKSSKRDKRKSSTDNKLSAAAESEASSSRQSEKNEEKPKCSSENNEMETGNEDEKGKIESVTRKEEPLGNVKHKNEPPSFDHHHHHHHHKKKKKKHKKDDKKDNCKNEKNSRRSSDRDSSSGPPSSSGNVADKKDKDAVGGNTSSSVTSKKERRRSSSDKHKSNHGDNNVTEDSFRSSIYGIDSNGEYRLLRKPKIVNNSSELWKVIQLRKQYAELERRRSIASESGDSEINNSSEGKIPNQFANEFDEAERKRSTFNESSDNEVNNNSQLARFIQSRKKYAELIERKRFVASESSDNEINGSSKPKVVIQFRKKRSKLKRKTNESNNCKINNNFIVRAKNECGKSNLRCSVINSNDDSIENKNSVRFKNEYDKLHQNRFTFDDNEVNNNSELEKFVHCEQKYVEDRRNFISHGNNDISEEVVRLSKNINDGELERKHLISNKNNVINENLKFQFESTEQKYFTSNNNNNNSNDRFVVTDHDKLEQYFSVTKFNNDEVNRNLECAKVREKGKYRPYFIANGHNNNEVKDDVKFGGIVQCTEIRNKLGPEHVEQVNSNDEVNNAENEHIEMKQRRTVANKSKINGIKTNYELKKAIQLRQKQTKRRSSIASRSSDNEYNSGLKRIELIQLNEQYPDLKLGSSTFNNKNDINNSSILAENTQSGKQHSGLEEKYFVDDDTTISNDSIMKEDIQSAMQCNESDKKSFLDDNINSNAIIKENVGKLNDQLNQECFADNVRADNYNSILNEDSQPEKQRDKLDGEKPFVTDNNVNSVLKENNTKLRDKLEQKYFNGSILKQNMRFAKHNDETENCFVNVNNGSILKVVDISSEKQRDQLEYSTVDESSDTGKINFSKSEKTVVPLLKLTDIAEFCSFDDNSLLCPKMNKNDVVIQKEYVILAGSAQDLLTMKLNTINDRRYGKNKSFDDLGEKSDNHCTSVKFQDEVISNYSATDNNGNEINNLSKASDLTENSGEETSTCISDSFNNSSKNKEDVKYDSNSTTDGILNGCVYNCNVSELNLATVHCNNLNNNLVEVKLDNRPINSADDSNSMDNVLNANSDDQRVNEEASAKARISKKRKSIIKTRWAKEKNSKPSVIIKEETAAAFDDSFIITNSTQLEATTTQENIDDKKSSQQENDKRISLTTATNVNGYDDSNNTKNSDGNSNSAIMDILDRLSKSEILTDDKKQFVVYVSKCLRGNTVKKSEQLIRSDRSLPCDNKPDDADVRTTKAIKIVQKKPNHKLLLDKVICRRNNVQKHKSETFKNNPCIHGTINNRKDGIESGSNADSDSAKPFFGFQFTLKNENISLFPDPQTQNATVNMEYSDEKHEQFETTNDKDITEIDESNTALRSIQNICKRKRAKDYYSHDELYKPRMTHSKSRRQRSMQL